MSVHHNTQLSRWPITLKLATGAKKRHGLAPWRLHNISRWEWKTINEWLTIHSYCGHISSIKKIDMNGVHISPFFCTESILWIDPYWQASCIGFIDSLPKRIFTVELFNLITRKQADKKFTGNFEIFSGYNYCVGSFSLAEDAFLATLGWE